MRKALATDAAWTAGGSLAAVGIGGVSSIIIARELGVEGRGEWAVISSLAVLVGTFATLGLPIAASYAAARVHGDERARLVRAALIASCAFAGLAAAVYFIASRAVRPPDTSQSAIVLGGVIAAGIVLQQVSHQLTLTAASVKTFGLVQVLPAIAMFGGVVVLAVGDQLTVFAVVLIAGSAALLGAVVAVTALVRFGAVGRKARPNPSEVIRTLRPYAGFALLTFGTISLTQVVQRFDLLLVEGFKGAYDAGLYAVAVQFGDLLLVAPAAVGYVLFREGAGERDLHWEKAVFALRWTLLLTAVLALAVGVVADPLLRVVFGSAFEPSASALRWLLPGIVLLAGQSAASSYIASRGRPRSVLVAWTAGAVLNVGAGFVVIPEYGADGAAAVSTLSYGLVVALHIPPLLALRPGAGAPSVDTLDP